MFDLSEDVRICEFFETISTKCYHEPKIEMTF